MTLTRDQVMDKVREHLAGEFELEAAEITAETRFKEDLDADSLDLYELVMELEDSYGVAVSREETTQITTVGDAVDFVFERLPGLAMARGIRRLGRVGRGRRAAPPSGPEALRELLDSLPLTLRRQALTHSSWVDHRADSYGRLAFLGDSVLGLAVAEHLFSRYPRADIGRLTKMHGQAVSGRACAEIAIELGVPELLAETAPTEVEGGIEVAALLASERALASVCEAVIGSCYLHHGFEVTATATVAAFSSQIELASERLLDFKSALQERLARAGARVRYDVTGESGPPHDRVFDVAASVNGEVVGEGSGRSKKAAEQAAAEQALEELG